MVEAESYKGPSLIIAYSPCISHGIKTGMGTSIFEEKRAVEAGYWHLYRYNPMLKEQGKNPFILESKNRPLLTRSSSREKSDIHSLRMYSRMWRENVWRCGKGCKRTLWDLQETGRTEIFVTGSMQKGCCTKKLVQQPFLSVLCQDGVCLGICSYFWFESAYSLAFSTWISLEWEPLTRVFSFRCLPRPLCCAFQLVLPCFFVYNCFLTSYHSKQDFYIVVLMLFYITEDLLYCSLFTGIFGSLLR